jgi:hypothetical protein
MKALSLIANIKDLSLGIPMAESYNGKPFLCTRSHSVYRDADGWYMESDVDTSMYRYIAKSACASSLKHISDMDLRFGLTVQGENDDELPEVVIGAACVHHLDMEKQIDLFPQGDPGSPAGTQTSLRK